MRKSRKDGSWTALAVFLLGVCFFAGLESIGLVGPDEPRYAWIGRAMAQTGDWITPRLWGHVWFQKPILYYWSSALSFRLFGLSDRAARLPSAVGALAGALLLGWAAWRLYGSQTAKFVLVIFPTTLGLFAFAHAATTDMLLTVSLEAAMICALFSVEWPGAAGEKAAVAKTWPLVATGAFIGLGTLAKGPVAIILAGGSVLLWAALTRRWRDAVQFLRWEPIAAFALVAVPWYAACSITNPGFAHDFFWHQNVQRFLTPVFEHVQPWWFFFPVLILGLLPWTAALLPAARDGWRIFRDGRAAASPGLLVACWATFPILFFSFSDSKLPGYILPAMPPLVLLMARAIGGGVVGPPERERSSTGLEKWTMAVVGLTWIALSVTAGHWLRRLPQTWDISHLDLILGVLAATAAVGAVVILLGLSGQIRRAVGLSALSMGVLVAVVAWVVLPQVNPYLSARHAARVAMQAAGPTESIQEYRLPRDWAYGLDYYLDRELPVWSPAQKQPAWVCTMQKSLPAITANGRRVTASVPLSRSLMLVRVSGPGP